MPSLARWTLPIVAAVLAACPGSHQTDDGPHDTTAPAASARPPGGAYGKVQYVRLIADEPGTIYWSIDGADPSPGAPNTRSASNPAFWLRMGPGTTTLKFLAVDAAGNRGAVVTETYAVDLAAVPPVVAGTLAFREICPAQGGSGTAIVQGDDFLSSTFTLPFGFSLYETPVAHYAVSTNGFIWFDPAGGSYYVNATIPSSYPPNGILAPYWDDLVTTVCQLADADSLVVEWRGSLYAAGNATVAFEAVLRASGGVDFVYGPDHAVQGTTGTIGAENLAGSAGDLISFEVSNPGAAPGHSYSLSLR